MEFVLKKASKEMNDLIHDPMWPVPFAIRRVHKETQDTFTIEIEPQNGIRGNGAGKLQFAPGQFNMLYVFGVGEVPISISGSPTHPAKLVHTIRAVGAVTKAIRKMKPGAVLGIRGPFGTHWPLDEAAGRDVVIVTGGVGLAPLRPAIYQLMARRKRYGKVILLYGARAPEEMLYHRELNQWRWQGDIEIHTTVDRAERGWGGNVGVVTTLFPKVTFDVRKAMAMVCGPEVMMRFTIMDLEKRGVCPENIFVSVERNMKCAIGFCGHCQYGPQFICKDGPVFRYDRIRTIFGKKEI